VRVFHHNVHPLANGVVLPSVATPATTPQTIAPCPYNHHYFKSSGDLHYRVQPTASIKLNSHLTKVEIDYFFSITIFI